ncbi:hypothetical protein AGMMS49942_16440 [Spirochaetia bacterium]|nr:hypothetical protein AGMMS49942_16440 [Spirochaetia bacterium]
MGDIEKTDWKCFNAPDYSYRFNLKTGYFARWGKTFDDDPPYSRFGTEIADIEISTVFINLAPSRGRYTPIPNAL